MTQLLAQAQTTAQQVDWLTVVATVLSVLTTLGGFGAWAKRAFVRAVNNALDTEDGSVIQILQRNSKTLGELVDELERLADSVREVRGQHIDLESRITRIEQHVYRRRGW